MIVQDNEDCSILTYWIVDFWNTKNSYKKLIESSGIAELSNRELQRSIKTNLEALYNHNSNYNMILTTSRMKWIDLLQKKQKATILKLKLYSMKV